jgi:hypothetical protein
MCVKESFIPQEKLRNIVVKHAGKLLTVTEK